MENDRLWIAVVGIGVSLLVGVPPLVALVAPASLSAKILIVTLAVVVLIGSIVIYRYFRLPTWTIKSHHSRTAIIADNGSKSITRKTLDLRCNRHGVQHYTHRNLSMDGTPTFRVDQGVTIADIEKEANDYSVRVRFPAQMKIGQKVNTWLEIDGTDVFTNDTESFTLLVDQPIKAATVEVLTPVTRPIKHSRALFIGSGDVMPAKPPDKVEEHHIKWESCRKISGLRLGEYKIEWDW